MPFLFPKINDQLKQGANIFGGLGGGTEGGEQGPAQVQQGGALNKLTAEGEIAGPAPSAPSAQLQQQQTPAALSTAIMGRNVTPETPARFQEIGQRISAGQQALEQEAGAYRSSIEGQQFAPTNEEFRRAVGGEKEPWEKASTFMSGQAAAPGVEWRSAVRPGETGYFDVSTTAGIENLLRKSGGAQYTPGESALDMALLTRSPGFQQQRQSLAGQQAALEQESRRLSTGMPEWGKTRTGELETAQRDASKGVLRNILGELGTKQQAEADELNKQISSLGGAGPDWRYISGQQEGVLGGLDPVWKSGKYDVPLIGSTTEGQSLADILAGNKVNPLEFYSSTAPELATQEQMINPEESAQFNRIYQLLGMPNVAQAGTAPTAATEQRFDAPGYQQAVERYLERFLPGPPPSPELAPRPEPQLGKVDPGLAAGAYEPGLPPNTMTAGGYPTSGMSTSSGFSYAPVAGAAAIGDFSGSRNQALPSIPEEPKTKKVWRKTFG